MVMAWQIEFLDQFLLTVSSATSSSLNLFFSEKKKHTRVYCLIRTMKMEMHFIELTIMADFPIFSYLQSVKDIEQNPTE